MAHYHRTRAQVLWRIQLLAVLGTLLALAAVVTVRDQPGASPRTLAERAALLADSLAGPSSFTAEADAALEWKTVADLATPWGRSVRLRPHVSGLAIPGSDLVVHEITAPEARAAIRSALARPGGAFTTPQRVRTGVVAEVSGEDPAREISGQASPGEVSPGEASTGEASARAGMPRRVPLRSASVATAPWRWADPLDAMDRGALAALGTRAREAERTSATGAHELSHGLSQDLSLDLSFAGHTLPATPVYAVRGTLPDERAAEEPLPGAPERGWQLWAEATIGAPVFAELTAQGLLRGEAIGPMDGTIPVAVRIDPSTWSILEARDLRILASGQALVFDPNPVVASGRDHLRDGDPVDTFRTEVTLDRLDDSGRLRGEHIRVESGRDPKAYEPTRRFAYPALDPRFEEAMAYYHGDRGFDEAAARGFAGLLSSPLILRVHGSTLDNSWYSRPDHAIVFGDGGVDDAEDADIILHEIGHALHDCLVPGFGGGDTRAISEGFADFWAGSLTGGPCVGDWDATAYSPPCLRRTDTDATYPASLAGRPHVDGLIWSALLWDLREILGASAAERLALAAFLEQDAGSTWTGAAEGLLHAALLVGLDPGPVEDALVQRGLLAREVALSLNPEEEARFSFLVPRNTLKRPARNVILRGDGSIRLEDDLGQLQATLTMAGPAGPAPGSRLDLVVRIEGAGLRVEQTWVSQGSALLAARCDWDGRSGEIHWTYLHATEEAEGFFAAVAIDASALPVSIDWNAQARSPGVTPGLWAVQGDLNIPPALTGARFRVLGEPAGFTLERLAAPFELEAKRDRLRAHPNPSAAEMTLRLLRSARSPVEVSIFDAGGRLVREHRAPAALGLFEWTWDGRDWRGERVAQGRYWARARAGSEVSRTTLVVLR